MIKIEKRDIAFQVFCGLSFLALLSLNLYGIFNDNMNSLGIGVFGMMMCIIGILFNTFKDFIQKKRIKNG